MINKPTCQNIALETNLKKKEAINKIQNLEDLNLISLNKLRYFCDSIKKEMNDNPNEILSIHSSEINRTFSKSLIFKDIIKNTSRNKPNNKYIELSKMLNVII